MKILVIQHKMIGDVLTTSILFEVLRKRYPDGQLDYLINDTTQPVVANNPYINKIWLFSKVIETTKQLSSAFYDSIKAEKYDVVVDVYAKLRSALLSKRSGATQRISYRKWYTKHNYTHTTIPKKESALEEGLAIENRILLLEPLIGKVESIPKPKIYLTKEEVEHAKQLLIDHSIDLTRPLYMIGILGSSKIKTYPLPAMARLLDFLIQKTDGQLLFNYIPSQQNEATKLYDLCSVTTKRNIYKELYGRDIREFLALTSHCDALIGNEGGAVNMAKALDVPTFSIFAPWILKDAWNSYEKTGENMSVHLKDFHPELYKRHPKKLKSKSAAMYQFFNSEYITPKLEEFLTKY